MGHIKRSITLATELIDTYDIVFLMQNYTDGVDYVRRLGWKVHTISVGDYSDQ